MPNHIKNRIEILGTKEKISEIFKTFNTYYPAKLRRAIDNTIICRDKTTDDNYIVGWFNEKTGMFKRRNMGEIVGLPEGWEMEIDEAFNHFPDFDKVFEMPMELKGFEPHGGIVTAVKKKYQTPISDNPLLASLELANRDRQTLNFEGKDKELFDKCCEAYEKTGYVYWYDWQLDNWGTKWNSYSCKRLDDNVFTFETAWSGVPKIIEAISKRFPNVVFIYEYADEDTGNNTGYLKFKDGLLEEVYPKGGSKEAYDIAFKLRPHYKDSYKLVGDTYEYVEDEE